MGGIFKAVSQPILHAVAAAAMMAVSLIHPIACGIMIGLGWLLRELAQRNSGDLVSAIRSMPEWPLSKHVEWIAPTGAAVFIGYLFNA